MYSICQKRNAILLGLFLIFMPVVELDLGHTLTLPPSPFESTDHYALLKEASDGSIVAVQAKVTASGSEAGGTGEARALFRYNLSPSGDDDAFYFSHSQEVFFVQGLNDSTPLLLEFDLSEQPIPADAVNLTLTIYFRESPEGIPRLISSYRPEQLLLLSAGKSGQLSLNSQPTVHPGTLFLGPLGFLRERGKPKTEQVTFNIADASGPFLLRLMNGTLEGNQRVSSAVVELNGKEIFRPSHLNQNVGEMTRQVSLLPGENVLEVNLRSIPGGLITLELYDLEDQACTLFGPRTFVRKKGKPVEEVVVFEMKPQFIGPFTLDLISGDPNGSHRVDSALIKLNGELIFSPNDFNEQVGRLSRTVTLQSLNTLSVELRGAPGDFLTLEVTGYDKAPPSVAIMEPANGAAFDSGPITVIGVVDDPSCSVTVNGTPVSVDEEGFFGLNGVELQEGENLLHAIATDACGNQGEDQIVVYLRTTPVGPSLLLCAEPFYEQRPKPPKPNYCKTQAQTSYLGLVTGLTDETAAAVTLDGVFLPVGVEVSGDLFFSAKREGNFFWAFAYIPEVDGVYPHTAVVSNAEGGQTEATISFLRDTTPPTIRITSPEDGIITSARVITITGTVDDPKAKVTLGWYGTPIPVVNGTFSVEVTLKEGLNAITIPAIDPYWNYSWVTISIVLDTIPPQISIISPQEGGAVNTPFINVTGTVTDQNIASLTLTVNSGQPQTLTLAGSNFSGATSLTPGSNTLTFTARDKAGNISSATRSVLLDLGAPVVSITAPAPGTIVSGSFTISVEASDAMSGIGGVTLMVDSQPQSNLNQPPFTFVLDSSSLATGSHTIMARAMDRAGNQAEASITVLSDQDSPIVSITSPASGTAVSGTITITVEASDSMSGVSSVTLLVNGQAQATLSQPPFYFFLDTSPFSGGSHTVSVRALDHSGNQGEATIVLIVDHDPPLVSITSPAPGASVSGTVTVTVEASDSISGLAGVALYVDNQHHSTLNQPPFNFVVDTSGLAPGSHSLAARGIDKAGNEEEASITVTVAEPISIEITSPTNGMTVNKSTALIQGRIHSLTGEVGVVVNGLLAEVQGSDFAVIMPLQVGPNAITATATRPGGLQGQASITINTESQEESIRLTAIPTSGILDYTGILNVTLEAEAYLPNPVSSYSWDFNGDGAPEVTGTEPIVTAQYQYPGLYFPRVTVTDNQGNIYTETALVNVHSRQEMDALLTSKWEGMKGALSQGNITEALDHFVNDSREEYREIFELLAPQLPALVSAMREINMVEIKENRAEYYIKRFQKGVDISYFIYFMRDENGIWRISSF